MNMKNLTIPQLDKIAKSATRLRDKELRKIGCSKESFSPADVRIIIDKTLEEIGD